MYTLTIWNQTVTDFDWEKRAKLIPFAQCLLLLNRWRRKSSLRVFYLSRWPSASASPNTTTTNSRSRSTKKSTSQMKAISHKNWTCWRFPLSRSSSRFKALRRSQGISTGTDGIRARRLNICSFLCLSFSTLFLPLCCSASLRTSKKNWSKCQNSATASIAQLCPK